MKKSISIKENINLILQKLSQETGLKQSTIIEKGILLFERQMK